ncbi:hypothetical protein BDW42DRAFT_34434 [Aspergillus taichungensis]|uniref:Uncharacterized protein n=1 Tax=Aspergillus taichungensis TaxID=482145 RepID=A0A2J5HFN3_9EURO|nr:hypothetical protein BDW42DRAFT_34434 [Aspergillus taichungensis]
MSRLKSPLLHCPPGEQVTDPNLIPGPDATGVLCPLVLDGRHDRNTVSGQNVVPVARHMKEKRLCSVLRRTPVHGLRVVLLPTAPVLQGTEKGYFCESRGRRSYDRTGKTEQFSSHVYIQHSTIVFSQPASLDRPSVRPIERWWIRATTDDRVELAPSWLILATSPPSVQWLGRRRDGSRSRSIETSTTTGWSASTGLTSPIVSRGFFGNGDVSCVKIESHRGRSWILHVTLRNPSRGYSEFPILRCRLLSSPSVSPR